MAAVCVGLGNRITGARIVSGAPPEMPGKFKGMWPPVRLLFLYARYAPPLRKRLLLQMGKFYADEKQLLKRMKQALPAPDVALIEARPDILETFSLAA